MATPNFFIVGAPKCGTTALYSYLKDHPNVFMSTPKELFFFATDHPKMQIPPNMEAYLSYFKDAQSQERYLAIGEGSTTYLSSAVAIQNIYDFNPHAKIIVMLRDPISLAQSLHAYQVFEFEEDEADFEKAWHLQEQRKLGQCIPPDCKDPYYLLYGEVAKTGYQVEKLLQIFPPEQVKIILFEDFVNALQATFEDLLAFMGVPSTGKTDFPLVYETRSRGRFVALEKFLIKPPRFVLNLKKMLHLNGTGWAAFVVHKITQKRRHSALRPEFRAELVEFFTEDVQKLEHILKRGLSHWLEKPLPKRVSIEPRG